MKRISILIGGDLVPTESNLELFNSANAKELFGKDVMDLMKSADFRVFNLEVPLVNRKSPINKCGPNLIAPTSTINGIKQLKPDLITLANNHILDQGEQGLYSTIQVLKENNISCVGAGYNIYEASKPYIWERSDTYIGFYTCAEHEFTIASDNNAGANPFNPLESLDHIVDLKKRCNYVIILYHGGKEHYRYPSPELQTICRKMVDKGADLVICQHSHCVGALENYKMGMILYGQGNFLFDNSEDDFWITLCVNAIFTDQGMSVNYIPIIKQQNTVRLADGKTAQEILEEFSSRSLMIQDDVFVRKEYDKFAAQMLNNYLAEFRGNNIIFKFMNKFVNRLF